MPQLRPAPQPRRSAGGVVERLYVFSIVSSLLLLILVAVTTLLMSGQLRRQAETITAQGRTIDVLAARLATVEQELAASVAPHAPPPTQARPPSPTGAAGRAAVEEEGETGRSGERLAEADVAARLSAAVRRLPDGSWQVVNRAAAEELVDGVAVEADWLAFSAATWERLAIAARLLDWAEPAELFERRAAAAGTSPRASLELSVRRLLAAGRPAEAVESARRLTELEPDDAAAWLLLAEALASAGDSSAAAHALANVADWRSLSAAQQVRLAGLWVNLEHWERAKAILGELSPPPPELQPQVNRLRGLVFLHEGKNVEAFAIFDDLLQSSPDDYDLRTWRGAALVKQRQFAAAREALAHAEQFPARPEAWYWRGVLEEMAGDSDAATPLLQRATAASGQFAPAWEALGRIALNRGDLATAQADLQRAAQSAPRRAAARFLLGLVHAKASRSEEAAVELRRAFELDASLLAVARQTEAIARLFSATELEALAAPSERPASAPAPGAAGVE